MFNFHTIYKHVSDTFVVNQQELSTSYSMINGCRHVKTGRQVVWMASNHWLAIFQRKIKNNCEYNSRWRRIVYTFQRRKGYKVLKTVIFG